MKEAALIEWKFNEGDWVEKKAIVLVIETEKVTYEVEAFGEGFLHILVAADTDAKQPVGAVVGQLAETEEELKSLQAESGVVAVPAASEKLEPAPVKSAAPGKAGGKGGRVRISPVAKKMAEANGIDINLVTGTGPGGRISKKDIELAIAAEKSAPAAGAPAYEWGGEVFDGKRVKEAISVRSGMRKAIASHMQQSLLNSAQLTITGEIDMTAVKKLRGDFLKQEERLQTRITYTDIFVMAVTKALKAHPIINSSLIDNEIKIWEDIHIGVAVAIMGDSVLDSGLIVPVLRNADQKSLPEISKELKVLVQSARDATILPDDVQGSTFTITNLGGTGGSYGFGTPIINQPESAILATGPITDRAVVRDGEIVVRPIMTYSFTFDHRVIDGAPATLFMADLTQLIENPGLMLC
jgi:pyruvate dehydrogenase E2 component (dihydrolipoamide acetyltransferase)/2-oxoglutarate dehydrogenase E2 component (dihydrolipoamide succinyltransferase)